VIDKKHRVTQKECEEAWAIFADREKYLSLSDEEECLVDAYIAAGQIKQETGEWPTLQEVEDKWVRESEERARKRDALIQECAAHDAKQQK
jgi:hypothetical protein